MIVVNLLFICPYNAVADPRIALVIGNGAYGADPLSDPPNDAQLIDETLRLLNFEVIKSTDVKQKEMKYLIRDFSKRLEENKSSVGLFYYSGHGMQVRGRNYMIPIDAKILEESDVSIWGVGVNEVLSSMYTAQNVMNFIILDACRDNRYEKSFKSARKGLSEMHEKDIPKGSLIAFAAEPHKVALQGSGKYSIFTEALSREMVKPDVPVEKVFKNVRIIVDKETKGRQLPVTENRLLGDFYFMGEAKDTNHEHKVPPEKEKKNWLLILLGVVVVGGVVALALSDGGGNGGEGSVVINY